MRRFRSAAGFTLVEMLTVVAIIGLLIGILVPSLNAARNQARNSTSQATVKTLDTGCELFNTDQGKYPRSGGRNPFESGGGAPALAGAQWLGLQLLGADLGGFVAPTLQNDAAPANNLDGKIDHLDWLAWYDPTSGAKKYARSGPYAPVDSKALTTPRAYRDSNPTGGASMPSLLLGSEDGGTGGSSVWNNGRISFFVDAFNQPILYYQASGFATQPLSTGSGNATKFGIYDQSHNAAITGWEQVNGEMNVPVNAGWDFADKNSSVAAGETLHPLARLGYSTANPDIYPEPKTFGAFFLDKAVFETTKNASNRGRLQPYRSDSFILISPGRDGRLGTQDDIKNFRAAGE